MVAVSSFISILAYATVGAAFIVIVIAFRIRFFNIVEGTLALLDAMLRFDADDESGEFQAELSKRLLQLMKSFLFASLVAVSALFLAYALWSLAQFILPLNSIFSWEGILGLSLSGLIFFMPITAANSDYHEVSMLLHRISLNNYAIQRWLFSMEKRFFIEKSSQKKMLGSVIVSGLARSGTTALMTQLSEDNRFFSLRYSNMPFILSPNSWKFIYNPKSEKKRERSHGDKLLFSENSPEALEEFFFKVQLNDEFIEPSCLSEHELSTNTLDDYQSYKKLIHNTHPATAAYYLAKNNNAILRLKSLNHERTKLVVLFREPRSHAQSLLSQHENYCEKQVKNGFVLEYMNWLGHHEFGLNHKPFKLGTTEFRPSFAVTSLNYWLEYWIYYYNHVISIWPLPNAMFVCYEEFLSRPTEIISEVEQFIGIHPSQNQIEIFQPNQRRLVECDNDLAVEAVSVYQRLKALSKQDRKTYLP